PRQMKEAGVSEQQLRIEPEVLHAIISRYTREAGVRQLERTIGRITRKTALMITEQKAQSVTVTVQSLTEFLGPEHFFQEQARENLPPGVSTGLAWTETGGDILYIEATLLPKGPQLTLTGQLGEVMQESAKAAHSYIWANCERWGIDKSLFQNSGVHIHVPAGAIPKDGPSAGVAMTTALASLYLNRPVDSKTAMTGEITLTGLVLPIGGVKEKVLAARRSGIRQVILPKQNEKDLRELPDEVRNDLKFVFVTRIEQVLTVAIPGAIFEPHPAMAASA